MHVVVGGEVQRRNRLDGLAFERELSRLDKPGFVSVMMLRRTVSVFISGSSACRLGRHRRALPRM